MCELFQHAIMGYGRQCFRALNILLNSFFFLVCNEFWTAFYCSHLAAYSLLVLFSTIINNNWYKWLRFSTVFTFMLIWSQCQQWVFILSAVANDTRTVSVAHESMIIPLHKLCAAGNMVCGVMYTELIWQRFFFCSITLSSIEIFQISNYVL